MQKLKLTGRFLAGINILFLFLLAVVPKVFASGITDCQAYQNLLERAKREGWTEKRLTQELKNFLPREAKCVRYIEAQRAKARCEALGGVWQWIDLGNDEGLCLAQARPIPCCVENPFAANSMCPPCEKVPPPGPCPPGDPSCCDWRTDPLCPRPTGSCSAFISADNSDVFVGDTVKWRWMSSDTATCNVNIQYGLHSGLKNGAYSTSYSHPGTYKGTIVCQSVDQGYGSDTCRDEFVVHVHNPNPAGYCAIDNFYVDPSGKMVVNAHGVNECWVWTSAPECLTSEALEEALNNASPKHPVWELLNTNEHSLGQVSVETLKAIGVNPQYVKEINGAGYEWNKRFVFAHLKGTNGKLKGQFSVDPLYGPNIVTTTIGSNYYLFSVVCQCQDVTPCDIKGKVQGMTYYKEGNSCMVASENPASYDVPFLSVDLDRKVPLLGDRETWGNENENFNKCWAWRLGFAVVDLSPAGP